MRTEDRFLLAIEDERERMVTGALWGTREGELTPELIARRYGDREARMRVGQMLEQQVRPFLAMYDAMRELDLRAFESTSQALRASVRYWPPMRIDWDEARKHEHILAHRRTGRFRFVLLSPGPRAPKPTNWIDPITRAPPFHDADLLGWWPLPGPENQ